MKKTIQVLFIITSLCFLFLFFAAANREPGRISAREKRALADFPTGRFLSSGYRAAFSAWLEDNIFCRDNLIDLKNFITGRILQLKPLSDDVAYGRDGWLFYKLQGNIQIASGEYRLQESQLEQIAETQQRISDRYKQLGKTYVFIIHPSKTSIYPEYLYGNYTVHESPADQIYSYLKAHTDVLVVDLKQTLLAHKSDGFLYYKTDTHWTPLGDYYVYTAIIAALNENGYGDFAAVPAETFQNNFRSTAKGDLDDMLGNRGRNRRDYTFPDIRFTRHSGEAQSAYQKRVAPLLAEQFPDAPQTFILENPDASGNIIIYADSQFAGDKTIVPLLAEHFHESIYVWSPDKQSLELAEAAGADIILYALGERFANREFLVQLPFTGSRQ